jgi:hypothetical protein
LVRKPLQRHHFHHREPVSVIPALT